MLSLQALSAVAVARCRLATDPDEGGESDVSRRALAAFATCVWNRSRPDYPFYSPTHFAEMWKVAKVWNVDEEFLAAVARGSAAGPDLHRVYLEKFKVAGVSEAQLNFLRSFWDKGISRYATPDGDKYFLSDFSSGADLPFGSGAREALDAIIPPSSFEELLAFLSWPQARRDSIRYITGLDLTDFGSAERALLSLLPNLDTIYLHGRYDVVQFLRIAGTLCGKIARIVLLEADMIGDDLPQKARELNAAGLAVVLYKVVVSSDDALVLKERFPKLTLVCLHTGSHQLVTGCLSPDYPRTETEVPPTDWAALVPKRRDDGDRADRDFFWALRQDPPLPSDFARAWILQRLEEVKNDNNGLTQLIMILCASYDSLQDVPGSERVAEVVQNHFGEQSVLSLSDPASWKKHQHLDGFSESTIRLLTTWANNFGEDPSETLLSHFGQRELAEFAASGDEIRRQVLSLLNAEHRRELAARLVCTLISGYGKAAIHETALVCAPSALFRYLSEGRDSWLVQECSVILRVHTTTEADWALALPNQQLAVEGLDLAANGMSGHRDLLCKRFLKVTRVWVNCNWGGQEPQGVEVIVGILLTQQEGQAGWRTGPQEFVVQTIAAAEMAKQGRPAQFAMYLKMAKERQLTHDQLNVIADAAVNVLAAEAIEPVRCEPLREKMRRTIDDHQQLRLRFSGGELCVSRCLFRLESQTATRAGDVVELRNCSERSVVVLKRFLESPGQRNVLDLTPSEARELREICLAWNLVQVKAVLDKHLFTELLDETFYAYEEWDQDYLSTLSMDERVVIERAWLKRWVEAGPDPVLRRFGWMSLPTGIELRTIGCLSEDSCRGSLLRRHVTTLHLPYGMPMESVLSSLCLVPMTVRRHFTRLAMDERQAAPDSALLVSLFPNVKTLLVGTRERTLQAKQVSEGKVTPEALKGEVLPIKSWFGWNWHLRNDVTADEIGKILQSVVKYGAGSPLLHSKEGVDFLVGQVNRLDKPQELLSVLWSLGKIEAADFSQYRLPQGRVPQADENWLKVCPFTGRAYFSGSKLPRDIEAASDVLQRFEAFCICGGVDSKQYEAFPTLFAGKRVRFRDFSPYWGAKLIFEERTYPAM